MDNLVNILRFFGSIPIFLVLFIIFIFVFRHNMSKNERKEKSASKAFWNQEQQSLVVRKKEIPTVDFIKNNFAALPLLSYEEYEALGKPSLHKIQEKCQALSEKPMMNVSHMLNSEVRLKYGTANLPLIENYENTYMLYIKNLYQLGRGLIDLDQKEYAEKFLEEGVNVGTDIADHFLLLSNLYASKQADAKINLLISQAKKINTPTGTKIVNQLQTRR